MGKKRRTGRCWYCKKVRQVRLCNKCKHYVCGWEDCPGSPCPGKKRKRVKK